MFFLLRSDSVAQSGEKGNLFYGSTKEAQHQTEMSRAGPIKNMSQIETHFLTFFVGVVDRGL